MSAPKTNVVYGLLADVETQYGTLPTLNVTDHGVQLMEQPEISDDWGFDGSRESSPGSGDTQVRFPPAGRIIKPLALKIWDKGAGAAYSASVKPRDLSAALQAAGFAEAGSFTGGAEKYTYTLTSPVGAPKSMGFEAYCRGTTAGTGEKWPVNGVYADWELTVSDGKPGIWTFNVQGRLNAAPSEVSWPQIAYAPNVLAPTAAPLVMVISGLTSLKIRSLTLRGGRQIQARFPDQNSAAAHGGYHPGSRAVELEFLMEASLFATFNPWAMREAATVTSCTFQVGSVQYNRTKFTLAQIQVRDVQPQADGSVPLTQVTCSAHSSTAIVNDSLIIVKD
jgi:hypothetical protein